MQLRYLATLGDIASDRTNTIVFPFPLELRRLLEAVTGTAGDSKA
jgi:hypothetical protein